MLILVGRPDHSKQAPVRRTLAKKASAIHQTFRENPRTKDRRRTFVFMPDRVLISVVNKKIWENWVLLIVIKFITLTQFGGQAPIAFKLPPFA